VVFLLIIHMVDLFFLIIHMAFLLRSRSSSFFSVRSGNFCSGRWWMVFFGLILFFGRVAS
jgi:hypothetical protein